MGFYEDWVASHAGVNVHQATNIEWVLKRLDGILGIFCPYRVNDLLFTLNPANPNQRYAGTTWIAWGQGRVPIGVETGTGNDETSTSKTFTVGQQGGYYRTQTHTHLQNPHSHTFPIKAYGSNSSYPGRGDSGGITGNITTPNTTATNESTDATTGGGGAMAAATDGNLQPYIACYMWLRVS
jgi:hypothetical protein